MLIDCHCNDCMLPAWRNKLLQYPVTHESGIGSTTMGTGGDWSPNFWVGDKYVIGPPTFGSCKLQKMQYRGLCSICYDESGSRTSTMYLNN